MMENTPIEGQDSADAEVLVIYHASCADGFAAAWVAWRAFCRLGVTAEYVPCRYGDAPPDVKGKRVFVLDFSFSREVLKGMAEVAHGIVVLDHHQTAQADLEGLELPRVTVCFDMAKCGAQLTQRFFFGTARNWLVSYIEDRDLWKWQLPYSREVSAYLQTVPHTFETFERVCALGLEHAKDAGTSCLALLRQQIEAAKRNARLETLEGHTVPTVNVFGALISDVVGELAEGYPFAIGWQRNADGRYVYSLRSRGDFDVSALARRFGGGGHARAAGFVLDGPIWEERATRPEGARERKGRHVAGLPRVSHDDAQGIAGRYNASHFRAHRDMGEHARYSIPADPLRDDDLRLQQYILQAESADQELAEARAALGPAWLAGGATLADGIARKCAVLEKLSTHGTRQEGGEP